LIKIINELENKEKNIQLNITEAIDSVEINQNDMHNRLEVLRQENILKMNELDTILRVFIQIIILLINKFHRKIKMMKFVELY
jgi:hypothetical protein